MANQISGPMGEVFGRDPVAYCLNMAKAFPSGLRELVNRCSKRTGITSWTTQVPGASEAKRLRMTAQSGDSPNRIALGLVAWAILRPGVMADEARRQATGLPVGPKATLDTEVVELPNSGWVTGGYKEQGEPITIAMVLSVAVPILIAIATTVFPAILSMVQGGFKKIGEPPKVKVDVGSSFLKKKILGIPVTFLIGGGALVALVALVAVATKGGGGSGGDGGGQ